MSKIHKNQKKADESGKIANIPYTIAFDDGTMEEMKKLVKPLTPATIEDMKTLVNVKPDPSIVMANGYEFNKTMKKLYNEMLVTGNVFKEDQPINDSATSMALVLTSDFIIPPDQLWKVKADFHKRGKYSESISCPKCQSLMNRNLKGHFSDTHPVVYFNFCYDCNTIWSRMFDVTTKDCANKVKLEWIKMIKNYLTNLGIVTESSKETIIEEF